jgi:hypothetical protein
VAVLVVCATAIALHHGGAAPGDGHHGMTAPAAVEACLAVFTAVGAGVVAVTLALIALGRWRPPLRLMPQVSWPAAGAFLPRARAGPALLLLLGVSRR